MGKRAGKVWGDCERKTRFRSENEAGAAIVRAGRNPRAKVPVRAYECPHCEGFHLTSSPARGQVAA